MFHKYATSASFAAMAFGAMLSAQATVGGVRPVPTDEVKSGSTLQAPATTQSAAEQGAAQQSSSSASSTTGSPSGGSASAGQQGSSTPTISTPGGASQGSLASHAPIQSPGGGFTIFGAPAQVGLGGGGSGTAAGPIVGTPTSSTIAGLPGAGTLGPVLGDEKASAVLVGERRFAGPTTSTPSGASTAAVARRAAGSPTNSIGQQGFGERELPGSGATIQGQAGAWATQMDQATSRLGMPQADEAALQSWGTPCGNASLEGTLPTLGGISVLTVTGSANSAGALFYSDSDVQPFAFGGCTIMTAAPYVLGLFTTDSFGEYRRFLPVPLAQGVSKWHMQAAMLGQGGIEISNVLSIRFGTIPGQAASPDVHLNEVYVAHQGIDVQEFVELAGPGGATLDHLLILAVDGDGPSAGRLSKVIDLSGYAIGSSGFFVAGDSSVPNLDLDLGAFEQLDDGTQTLYLVDAFTQAGADSIRALLGRDVDPEDDGLTPFDAMGRVLDVIAMGDSQLVSGGAIDVTYDGAEVVTPMGGNLEVAGIFRGGDYPNPWCRTALDFDHHRNQRMPRTPGKANPAHCTGLDTASPGSQQQP